MSEVFSHSGDQGDLLAHLPIVRGLGGGKLILFPSSYTGYRMTPERVANMAPLLLSQPYIHGVEWASVPSGRNLDDWRNHYKHGLNITDMACDTFGLAFLEREQPWLVVDPQPVARVIFARSGRYHNDAFPWVKVYERYKSAAVFVGTSAEHNEFERDIGPIDWHPTADMLDLARVIAGCELFVGNQSSPYWIAEGLKVPTLLEITHFPNNSHWERAANLHGWSADWLGCLPPLDALPWRQLAGVAARGVGHTLLTADRLERLAEGVRACRDLPGDMAELGCYRGGSAKVISGMAPHKVLHLFDTFDGLPEDDQDGKHKRGEFSASEREVRAFMFGHRVEFHVGRFPETAAGSSFCFVHLDADTYQSTLAGLDYFWPKLVEGGRIYLDDYGWRDCPGVDRAVSERVPNVKVNVHGQHGYIIKQ